MVFGRKQNKLERESRELQGRVSTRFTALQSATDSLVELDVQHEILSEADEFLVRSDQRRVRWGSHTVAALLGGSGSGKSALFNALSGTELREVSVQRPTSTALGAAVWVGELAPGVEDPESTAGPILDRMQVAERTVAQSSGPAGLILIDAPDLDSVQIDHWAQARTLADAADILIWVVDPQKYADEQLHRKFLADYAHLAPLSLVVLNQADLLTSDDQKAILEHLEKVLQEVGFDPKNAPRTLATSALTGQGTTELMAILGQLAQHHTAVYQRMHADALKIGQAMTNVFPVPLHIHPPEISRVLVDGIAQAAGLEDVAAIHARTLRKQYRLLGGRKSKPGNSSSKSAAQAALEASQARRNVTEVGEHQQRRVRRVLFDWFRPWATSVGKIWAPVLEQHAAIPRVADNLSGQLGSWWSLEGELAPRAPGAGILRGMRWLGLGTALVGVLWLILEQLGPAIQVYLNDPPMVVIKNVGEFGLPVVLIVAGLLWWFIWSVFNSIVRALVAARHRRQLTRIIDQKLTAIMGETFTKELGVRLHTLGQYRNSVLQLMGKAH